MVGDVYGASYSLLFHRSNLHCFWIGAKAILAEGKKAAFGSGKAVASMGDLPVAEALPKKPEEPDKPAEVAPTDPNSGPTGP